MDLQGRTVVFKSLVGSYNYNLNTQESDKDYKIFTLPNFDDLYSGNMFSKDYVGVKEDFDIHDIRKCQNLWSKANVNFLEVLFSEEFIINPNLNYDSKKLVNKLYDMRDYIAKMNLKYLYRACIGMHYSKMKLVDKGTTNTKELVNKYGYDTKQASQALRILDFLMRFEETNFNDFKKAIYYEDSCSSRKLLLDLKEGRITKLEFKKILVNVCDSTSKLMNKYESQEFQQETNLELLEIIKKLVKLNI